MIIIYGSLAVTFQLPVSDGIICPSRQDHWISVIDNESRGCNQLLRAKNKIRSISLFESEITYLQLVYEWLNSHFSESTHLMSLITQRITCLNP